MLQMREGGSAVFLHLYADGRSRIKKAKSGRVRSDAGRSAMKNKIINSILLLCVLAGIGILSYPFVSNMLHDRKQDEIITEYDEQMEHLGDEEKEQMLEAAREYNEDLIGNVVLSDPFDPAALERINENYDDLLNYEGNGIMGYVEIPRMDVELPVYLGATRKNMERGAVQLGQTSLPVGGVNTNCVIAAHRGYRGIPMFRDIEALRPGDEVIVHNFWETLTYEVSEIQVIYPSDIDKVLIRPGEDMVTLLTCHPYTQHTRRYAVFCTRTTGEETAGTEAQDGGKAELSAETAEKAASEAGDILRREKLLRTAGYGFLAAIGAAIAGKAIWNRAGRRRRFRK